MAIESQDHGNSWLHLLRCLRKAGAFIMPLAPDELSINDECLIDIYDALSLLKQLQELHPELLAKY